MTLAKAYSEWARVAPEYGYSCCSKRHFLKVGLNELVPIADEKVCERELAWRNVVRIRDKNPRWPTVLKLAKF